MLDDLELGPESIPGYKLGLHIFQIIFASIFWILEIVVFRSNGATVNGQNGWPFGVCFLSIPAWIYLIGTPRSPRTRRFAEPHAMVCVDALMFIFWLSAFASQAAYNGAGLCGGACSVSAGVVALGVLITLAWGGTTFLSVWTLKYWQLNGSLPGYERTQITSQNIDPDKAAFSTAPHDEEAYVAVQMNDHDHDHDHGHGHYDDAYGGHGADPYGAGPAARHDNPFDDHHNAYAPQTGAGRAYAPPTAQDDFEDDRPVQFPAGEYDRGL